jgi:hypothetical protein
MRRSHGEGEGPGPVAVLALGRQRAEVLHETLVARSQVRCSAVKQVCMLSWQLHSTACHSVAIINCQSARQDNAAL